jgi:Mrp family chromosome partitioning ATPase
VAARRTFTFRRSVSPRRRPARNRPRPPSSTPAAWVTARARNALRRPLFIGTVGVVACLASLIALIVVPQQARRATPVVRPGAARPDTESTMRSLAVAERQVAAADSAIATARAQLQQLIAATAAAVAADTTANGDTLSADLRARRDSLTNDVETLDRLLGRAENAPLLASYRGLAQAAPMQGDPRVKQLLDSLVEIERERESYNAVGGVDPVFVALTARANELGRSIQGLAEARRVAEKKELVLLAPPPPVVPAAIASRPLPDTMARIHARDTARVVAAEVANRLARERAELQRLDIQEEQAQARLNNGASISAILAAALVIGAMLGFGFVLLQEVRNPRVSDGHEIERATGVRVLGEIRRLPPSPERGRRSTDRTAPSYIDPGGDGHQLVYQTVATAGSNVVMLTVTGDSPAVSAAVAINFAAIAADEARGTLLVDTDGATSTVSRALRLRPGAGLGGVVAGTIEWPDAIRTTRVGRDRSIEVVPSGAGEAPLADVTALFEREIGRLSRRYDAIVLVSSVEQVVMGLPTVLTIPDVIYVARAGLTPIADVKKTVEEIQRSGAQLRGIVLWNAPDPVFAEARVADKGEVAIASEVEATTGA